MQKIVPFVLMLFVAGPTVAAAPRPFLDLDFEAAECRGGWPMMARGYQVALDATVAHSGKQSLRMGYTLPQPWREGLYGVSAQQFPVAAVAGKKIRFSGFIKTAGVTAGYAGFWWRADGDKAPVAFDNMEGRGAQGTTPWTRYQIELDVPAGAKAVYFGFLLDGNGTAWFDDLSVEIDGARWAEGPPPSAEPPSAAALAWLKARAIPFDTPEAGHGFADLQPLKKVIGGARVVALGEGTHGTREFFQMKHRLTEFLASEMGFTLFAIEANMPEAYRLNDYVLTGKGDPKELLKGMYFWTWDTQEVLDMIEWMRRFNQSGKGHIQFLGFDMQTPTVAAKNARTFTAKADPEMAAKLAEAFALVERADDAQGPSGAGTVRRPVPGLAKATAQQVRLSGWIKTKDVTEGEAGFSWGAQGFGAPKMATTEGRGAKGTTDWQRFELALPAREEVKTLSLEAYLKGKGTAWIDDLAVEVEGAPYQGGELNLGFEAEDGLAGWFPSGKEYEIAPDETIPGSVESYFHAAGLPRFILDLRGIPADAPSAAWLAAERPFRSIGALAVRCSFSPTVVSKEYDGLIWLDQSSPSVLLR